jgi:opacity protein-like surface antigen
MRPTDEKDDAMRSLSLLALVGAAVVLTTPAASAADFPPLIQRPAPAYEFARGWYLRGDIGMTNQRVGGLDNVLFAGTAGLVIQDKNFESGMLVGLGIGYQYNNWLRFDLTGEYRGEVGFHGFDTWVDAAGDPRFNNYTAKKSEWLALANVYFDLGTWYGVTPFIGAGAGMARVGIHSMRDAGIAYAVPGDVSTGFPTMAYGNSHSQWNFAWAIHAGFAFQVSPALTLELAYRYLDMGEGRSGDMIAFDGTNLVNNPMIFRDLTSHDVKLGIRWLMDRPVPPPLMTKG